MDCLLVLKVLTLLFLLDLGSAADSCTSYDIILDGKDWRQHGYISPVQNQGNCAASWIFSTVGAVEAHLAIKNRRLEELSAQQVLDCISKFGCKGGYASLAFNYTYNHGIASKASYPYRGAKSPCSYDPSTKVGEVKNSVTLHDIDEMRLAEIVYNIGPVVVTIDSQHKSFSAYQSGIYREENCRSDRGHLTGAFLVVGFGTDSLDGEYWILKTSFGQDWGEGGYMRLARNAGNMCGVGTLVQYPIV